MDFMPEWSLDQLSELATKYNGNTTSRVEIALGFDGWFLPKDLVLGAFERLRKSGVRLITSHVSRNAFYGRSPQYPSVIFADDNRR